MSLNTTSSHEDLVPPLVRALAPYFCLILAVFGVYGNVYDNQFVFDDDLLIQLNSYLSSWSHIGDILTGSTISGAHIMGGFYRPIQILLYLVTTQVFGGTLFWYHLLNISLHAANTCLVYRIGIKLKFKSWGVFFAALIWCLHTLHTEAITYISATADPLFAFFCLLAIVVLLPDITQRKIFAVIPLFLLGLLSKETTAMFPLLVMSCLFLTEPQRLKLRTYFRTWPLWLITIIFVIWRSQAQGFDGPQTYGRYYDLHEFSNLKIYSQDILCRFWTFLATLPVYTKLLIWPTGLHMERAFSIYTNPWQAPVIVGFFLLSLMAFQLYRTLSQKSQLNALSWGCLWFLAAHSPDTGIIIPMNALFLEHWMYLPTVGLFLGLSETLTLKLQENKKEWAYLCASMALAFASMLAIKTYEQNFIWKNPGTFYNNIFSYGEKSARSRNNLALYYTANGDYVGALNQFNEAVKISDSYAETRYNMAITYMQLPDKQGNIQNAIDCLNQALVIDPKFFRAYYLLGQIYETQLHDKKTADYYYSRGKETGPKP